jgi:hypothetical protein
MWRGRVFSGAVVRLEESSQHGRAWEQIGRIPTPSTQADKFIKVIDPSCNRLLQPTSSFRSDQPRNCIFAPPRPNGSFRFQSRQQVRQKGRDFLNSHRRIRSTTNLSFPSTRLDQVWWQLLVLLLSRLARVCTALRTSRGCLPASICPWSLFQHSIPRLVPDEAGVNSLYHRCLLPAFCGSLDRTAFLSSCQVISIARLIELFQNQN